MTPTSDIWDMTYTHGEEKLSFSGSKPKTITELLIGVKQWMETKKKEHEKSNN